MSLLVARILAKIHDDHPNITKENSIEYIDDFYITNSDELGSVLKDTELCFNEIKSLFFLNCKKFLERITARKITLAIRPFLIAILVIWKINLFKFITNGRMICERKLLPMK